MIGDQTAKAALLSAPIATIAAFHRASSRHS
jgi:hypothetical protein